MSQKHGRCHVFETRSQSDVANINNTLNSALLNGGIILISLFFIG